MIPETKPFQWAAISVALCLAAFTYEELRAARYSAIDYVSMARWIDTNTPQDSRIAAVETGTLGWYCDHYLIDIVGLTTPPPNARLLLLDHRAAGLHRSPSGHAICMGESRPGQPGLHTRTHTFWQCLSVATETVREVIETLRLLRKAHSKYLWLHRVKDLIRISCQKTAAAFR